MKEREGVVTLQGNPVVLLGEELKAGVAAPDFNLVGNDLSTVALGDFKDKILVISVVPSLDTPVCDLQTKRFNKEAGELGDGVAVLTVSVDLPFAQARWCGAADAKNLTTASDHRDAAFGAAYGVLIKDLRLLARAIFVVGRDGKITYTQTVPEIANEPDYDAAISEVKNLLQA